MKVAAIVPAFNEEKTIGGVVKTLKSSSLLGEVIVISDGSKDKTAQVAREAGADMVHELPWRHGKGSAMSHGVTHTDAPILFFADADLSGFTIKHIEDIVKPVLEGTYTMNVGLRDRGGFFTWLQYYLPLIGGERAMLRKVFTDIPDYYMKGFKAESALNYYCRANKLPYGKTKMPGIRIVKKITKFGFWGGLKEYFKMAWQIIKAMTEVRLNRRVFTSRGAHLKHTHTLPLLILAGCLFWWWPFASLALETGSLTEDFAWTSRREERDTYAFWDTRNKEVTLPLQYTVRNLSVGLKDLGGPVTAVAPEGDTLLVTGTRSGVIFRVRSDGTAENITGSGVTMPGAVALPLIPFAGVASRFNRLTNRIQQNALVAEEGVFTYAAGPGLFVSLGGGLELSEGRIPELQGADVRIMTKVQDRTVRIGGSARGAPLLLELTLQGFVSSAALQSNKLADAGGGRYFKKATLIPQVDLPDGTSIEYLLSADGGQHFEAVNPGVEHEFRATGNDLRFRATLFSSNSGETPHLIRVRVDFVKAEVETPARLRDRDSQRVFDLRELAAKLEQFKRDRGVYPIIDDQVPRVRLEQLGQLLRDGRYLTRLPDDPQHAEDLERTYDYLSSKAGNAYVLAARLEEASSRHLEKDVEGKPVEPSAYTYTCDDPWYCEGKGFTVAPAVEVAPTPRGTAEVVVSEDGRMYRIATVGGSGAPLAQRRVYIPHPSVLYKLRNFYGQMQKVGRAQVEQIPRARLVKLADKNDIYYITATFLKRRLPSPEVFQAYGNREQEIVTVQPEELAAYGESRLIQLTGDKRVWYLEGGVRRLVLSPEVMKRRGLLWKHVAPVNFAEYNSYPIGEPLQ